MLSLEEQPPSLVGTLLGFAMLVLAVVHHAMSHGVPSRLLTAILHPCLAKKQPAWLLLSSRPVKLEP